MAGREEGGGEGRWGKCRWGGNRASTPKASSKISITRSIQAVQKLGRADLPDVLGAAPSAADVPSASLSRVTRPLPLGVLA